jgi:hypothetical protein
MNPTAKIMGKIANIPKKKHNYHVIIHKFDSLSFIEPHTTIFNQATVHLSFNQNHDKEQQEYQRRST